MSSTNNQEFHRRHLHHNITVNVLDGSFFGFAMGFASFVTIIPLFISQLTDSAILIGLIPAIHSFGWQIPQLFTASGVSRLRRYKPRTLAMTIHERLPFFGLALVAWYLPKLEGNTALALIFLLLIWQGFGGGFTANAWMSMIAKLMPPGRRGTFFGIQSSAANALASLSAILAGLLLTQLDSPLDFASCFFLAGLSMAISWLFLSLTREQEDTTKVISEEKPPFWRDSRNILRKDHNFRWFLVVRILSQFSLMGSAFYIVYAAREFGLEALTAGIITGVFMFTQIIANPILGWLGDRWSPRGVIGICALAGFLSALLAWLADSANWFYPVFILTGLASVAYFTVTNAMMVGFGLEVERPVYIGLSNTLIAPATILAPLLGGWLADLYSYQLTFAVSAVTSLMMAAVIQFLLRDP